MSNRAFHSADDLDLFKSRLIAAWAETRGFLRDAQNAGHWKGELSTSALSTATAISALAQSLIGETVSESAKVKFQQSVARGTQWLVGQQKADGGFGDTDRSHSNIATTLLAIAAFKLADRALALGEKLTENSAAALGWAARDCQSRAWKYVESQGKWEGLRARYGKDKTFVVPILSNCALAGLVQWTQVPVLPFEAAWLPQEFYRWIRLPVVSYAIPALVAIGQARYHFAPPRNPLIKALRRRAIAPTLAVLRRMQPGSGGYLEAVPLTSFVLMSLAATGRGQLPVAQDCLRFLRDSQLADGSWPIDTNLAGWVTSLSIKAEASRGKLRICTAEVGKPKEQLVTSQTVRWLLACQHRRRHPFTGANPGGWGWTDLSGAVPDADDTPAALLALASVDLRPPSLGRLREQTLHAVCDGLNWLLRLQNRDGGWPTFCRGWGQLPFDRSGSDLTAHALRAIEVWLACHAELEARCGRTVPTRRQLSAARSKGLAYLRQVQHTDGSWCPLWFGNQDRPDEDNPIYGTGRVLLAYADLGMRDSDPARRGVAYLRAAQNTDGGWGGGSSVSYEGPGAAEQGITSTIEETAVAVEALMKCGGQPLPDATIIRGLEWLLRRIAHGQLSQAWPIGFYFAKLWYYERLYPAVFSLGALGTAIEYFKPLSDRETPASRRG